MNDNALVERFRRGDRSAAQAIVQRHNKMLWRIARGIVRDDADAEEVVQDAYVRALTSLDGFRGESSVATWLSRIVVNEALRRRERQRQPASLDDIADTLAPDHPGSVTMARAPTRKPRRPATRSAAWWRRRSTRCRSRSGSSS